MAQLGNSGQHAPYPVQFSVDYPEGTRDRLSCLLRIVLVIPILAVLFLVSGGTGGSDWLSAAGLTGGTVFFAVVLTLLFRGKYPKWWFDWNLGLVKFENRVLAYLALLRDEYPSTDEEQGVHLEIPYPKANEDLNRWLPLVKWLLALPHWVVLGALMIASVVVVVVGWFAILMTGRLPRPLFGFLEGTLRWSNRVWAYAGLLSTDRYPPFRLSR